MFGIGIFKKNKKAPAWDRLTPEEKTAVAQKMIGAFKNFGRYRIVSGFDQTQRELGMTETKNEDGILDAYRRGRLLDQTRNAVRNSATFNTILKQMDFNVCGTKAGKAILNFPDLDLNKEVVGLFSEFTRSADFFDGHSFNTVLKLVLKNALIGGDCVLLFDNGLIEDSGKLLIYESDEIGDVPEEALKRHYGQSARQSLGKVYNANGRWIGTTVSRSQRGVQVFDPAATYFLRRNPDASPFDSLWLQPSNVWRVAQGRGVSQAASSLATILDLEDLCGFELQAAKKNSQTFAQIYKASQNNDEGSVPSAFDTDTDFSSMTDEEIEAATQAESLAQEKTISFERAKSAGIIYEAMPEDYRMELLSTSHPNEKIEEFVKWLAGRSSAVFGLSEAYATLMPLGADFRAQQLLTAPAFMEAQKFLEQICDWTLVQFVKWADKKGKFDVNRLPADWLRYVSWSFPKMDELDENQHQDAIAKMLQNSTATYRDILGNDWREKLLQTKDEIAWFKANGLAHPSFQMISGGERTGAEEVTE